ncbi:lipoprotein intramolecular transacylase Lit [Cellvibrio fontiphilus]|uniref:DUF1461 domain-containing protein n=1 Tax=Cellvibrio fontiphilus TaxID=1815559 RepID=A0ABV7FKH8_9GAMM
MKKRAEHNVRKTDTASLPGNWRQTVFWPVFFTCQLISLALLSWHLLAQFHFAYPLGYQLLGLDQHIAEFAPQNRFKDDFEFTSSEEHWRLFGEISDAVQNSGKGLGAIHYGLANGQHTPLMHEAEIVHLQDVANLIDRFYLLGLISLVLWLGMIGLARWKKYLPPTTKKVLLGFLIGAVVAAAVVMLIGPTAVFYWLHVQVFPEGHQWFFYYEDSLMTTLMKAPDIFAFIALLLVALLIIFWCISTYLTNRLLNSRR